MSEMTPEQMALYLFGRGQRQARFAAAARANSRQRAAVPLFVQRLANVVQFLFAAHKRGGRGGSGGSSAIGSIPNYQTTWRKPMNTEQEFYICMFCFGTSETNNQCHDRVMAHYPGFLAGDARLKPLVAESGGIKTRMPRWMLDVQT